MSPEAQQIAIAEACNIQTRFFRYWYSGHDNTKPFRDHIKTRHVAEFERAKVAKWGVGEIEEYTDLRYVPNYPTDLNAMHEAEKGLTISQLPAYFNFLRSKHHGAHRDPIGFDWICIHATADHRAEAFLRTIGKWEGAR